MYARGKKDLQGMTLTEDTNESSSLLKQTGGREIRT